ncbi:c-type cytochrome, methanol metabolism-related [Breoghania sp. L-A4]|uniref:c-type cytochrome, methanol metabolism-related n=1 Tax=Breoghania sp. L-A4 TaxID=2304600 RepID=UPI000E35E9AC|nr:c-type cytochrome, methanol metabolism-related [Breoghania sp. L-A4]AXS42483.1 c-type cytochrome, methanol metabolism-related [Breoghania sp. L-A4]
MRSGLRVLSIAAGAMLAMAFAGHTAFADDGEEVDWEKRPYIVRDGKVDYGTYNGFRRYHSACHVCHGPDGLGSSYAPALRDSLKTMSYSEFLDVVVNGRQVVNTAQDSVMPAFAESADVMEYIDHIYAYLKARADGVIGRNRPPRIPADEDPVFKEWKASR